MRYLLILFLVMAFVVGCGCSNVLTPPVFAQPTKDVFPIFFGTDNGGPDFGYMSFYDQGAAAWQAPRLIANDLLNAQWTPQRNAVAWCTNGRWHVTFIEDTSNDLEIWESPDTGWQDDAGAWTLTDDDASDTWLAVDVETRQNYVWAHVSRGIATAGHWYIDLSAGAPNWATATTAINMDTSDGHYSVVLDQRLRGGLHTVFHPVAGSVDYAYGAYNGGQAVVEVTADYPQVVADKLNRTWVFYTNGNALFCEDSGDIYAPIFLLESALIHTATALTDDYHAAWLKYDDTIHVVLVDHDNVNPNATYLIYLRRTPNGWSAPVTLRTVDGSMGGARDELHWPQICVDTLGNMFISYIYVDFDGVQGDLCGYYLDKDDYNNYTVVGAGGWIAHANIDQSATVVVWAIMPDSVPIEMRM